MYTHSQRRKSSERKKNHPLTNTSGERRALFTNIFDLINDGLIDKYSGDRLNHSDIGDSEGLLAMWMDFRSAARKCRWEEVTVLYSRAGVISLFREMAKVIALKAHPNTKEEYVFQTARFVHLTKKCGVTFNDDGCFINIGPTFEAFLEAYKIN
jgi:hypothetical protein